MKKNVAKLRICHCLWTGEVGGIERVTTTLVLAQKQKHTVGVLFGKAGGPFYQQLRTAGVPAHILGMKSGFTFSPRLLQQATSFFQQFDVIHLQAFNYLLWIAAFRSGKKIVFTFHSLTSLRKKPNWRDRISKRFMASSLKKSVHQVTTVSQFARQHLEKEFPGIDIEVVPNCILPLPQGEPLTRKALDIPADAPVLLTYGRLVWHKRVDWVVERLQTLLPQFPNLVYIIEGEGPEKARLQSLVQQHNLEAHVKFPGFSDRIFDLLPIADACVFPSHAESFGLVSLECLQAGKAPFVLADGGGLAEVLAPLEQGRFVAETPDELMQKVAQWLLDQPQKPNKDWKRLLRNYDANAIAERYYQHYTA
ncbi:MAG: glycosyltransferase family 4 protein [Salibacteraceae bacterium]